DVVMALDVGRGLRPRLDHVRVQRPLDEELRARLFTRDLFEDANELLADRLPLRLGVGDAREPRQEPIGGLHVDQWDSEMAREGLLDLLRLALAVQAVIDE